MALTSRKPRPLNRSVSHLRDTRLIIIAAEGRVTEGQYFEMFRSTRVQVRVLPAGNDDRSAPEYVLQRLRAFRDEYSLAGDDELWLMLDVDRWGDGKLASIAREAQATGFRLAISHPCFESWLLFHFSDHLPQTQRCDEIEAELRAAADGSYNKRRLDIDLLLPRVRDASSRARAADPSPRDRWPRSPGSHVYRVIESLPVDCFPPD